MHIVGLEMGCVGTNHEKQQRNFTIQQFAVWANDDGWWTCLNLFELQY